MFYETKLSVNSSKVERNLLQAKNQWWNLHLKLREISTKWNFTLSSCLIQLAPGARGVNKIFPVLDFRPSIKNPDSKSAKEIPVRATIFSGLSVVPYVLVLAAIFNLRISYLVRGAIVRTLFQLLDIFRCPLTSALIFASNRRAEAEAGNKRSNENVRMETSFSTSTF